MPGYDGTGPGGQGPMTGRGLGPCNDGSTNNEMGRGSGRGLGIGRGLRRGLGLGRGRGFKRGPGRGYGRRRGPKW